jgi:hypothetical protein
MYKQYSERDNIFYLGFFVNLACLINFLQTFTANLEIIMSPQSWNPNGGT